MIRSATPDDAPVVIDVAVDSGLFPADDTELVSTMMAEYFGARRDEGHVCVVDDDGEGLSVAYYEPAPAAEGTWYLTMIAVRHERQGQGRGGALMRYVEDDLRARGQRLLLVETSGVPAFERTRAFYDKCGYEEEARVRDYYQPGDDMVMFRKALQLDGPGPAS